MDERTCRNMCNREEEKQQNDNLEEKCKTQNAL